MWLSTALLPAIAAIAGGGETDPPHPWPVRVGIVQGRQGVHVPVGVRHSQGSHAAQHPFTT